MKSTENYIDNLYSIRFENFNASVSNEEWLNVTTELDKKGFFRYRWLKSSVFSATLGVISLVVVYLINTDSAHVAKKIHFLQNISNEAIRTNINQKENALPDMAGNILINNELGDKEETFVNKQETNEKQEIKTGSKESQNNSLNIDSLVVKQEPKNIDTIQQNADKQSNVKIKKVTKKIVIRKDQIVITDTVKIRKVVK